MNSYESEIIQRAAEYGLRYSHDLQTPVGVALDTPKNGIVFGANRLASMHHPKERRIRPTKDGWIVHAEINAIANAARDGISLLGSTLYMAWFPCLPCAAALCEAGIIRVVGSKPNWEDTKYRFAEAKLLFDENGVVLDWTGGGLLATPALTGAEDPL